MWDDDPDIIDAIDEHDFEYESAEDFADFGMDSDMGELTEAEALDDYSSFFEYEE